LLSARELHDGPRGSQVGRTCSSSSASCSARRRRARRAARLSISRSKSKGTVTTPSLVAGVASGSSPSFSPSSPSPPLLFLSDSAARAGIFIRHRRGRSGDRVDSRSRAVPDLPLDGNVILGGDPLQLKVRVESRILLPALNVQLHEQAFRAGLQPPDSGDALRRLGLRLGIQHSSIANLHSEATMTGWGGVVNSTLPDHGF